MYLTQGIHRAVQQFPDKIATVYGQRRTTFAQLAERAARFAGGLQALGLQAGDRVAMLAMNSDCYFEYYLGTWWGGGVANPVNTRWSVPEIVYSLNDCETGILIVDDQFLALVPEILQTAPTVRKVVHIGNADTPQGILSYEQWLQEASPLQDVCRRGDDLAVILYTGGTTGFPKGVMLSHTNLWSAAIARMAQYPVPPDQVTLVVAPMFHTAALAKMVTQCIVGGTSVVLAAFRAEDVMRTIQQEQVDDIMLVPSMIQMLLDDPALPRYDLSGLKRITYGASPMSVGVLERAMQTWPHAGFFQSYGMTETAPVVSINPPEDHGPEARRNGRFRSAGKAGYAVELRVVDGQGKEVPRNTVGEVVVRGANVMLGYWNKPDATAEALRDGWMHTGDGAYMDDDGYLYIVDRLKDMIVSGGENVYCAEVENVLSRHPAVAACSVIGIPHEKWGESVHAVVVLRDDQQVDEDDLRDYCRKSLAGYKCPRSIEFQAALPLSSAGKVLKQVLREPYWKGHSRAVN